MHWCSSGHDEIRPPEDQSADLSHRGMESANICSRVKFFTGTWSHNAVSASYSRFFLKLIHVHLFIFAKNLEKFSEDSSYGDFLNRTTSTFKSTQLRKREQ